MDGTTAVAQVPGNVGGGRLPGACSRPEYPIAATTVADTWAWLHSGDTGVMHERVSEQGLDPAKEHAVLGRWDARELDHCGGY